MDTAPFIESLRQDLARSAEIGEEPVRNAAARLIAALEPAVRLVLLEALAQAAAEISAEAVGISIEVRLRGREPVFAVVSEPKAAPQTQEAPESEDAEGTARITLRLPEPLKARAEALAARAGQSLNTWLVGAARAAAGEAGAERHARHRSTKRVQGWAR